MDGGSITDEPDRLVACGVKSIEAHGAEVRARDLEILQARQHAARAIRHINRRTLRSGNALAATTRRRIG